MTSKKLINKINSIQSKLQKYVTIKDYQKKKKLKNLLTMVKKQSPSTRKQFMRTFKQTLTIIAVTKKKLFILVIITIFYKFIIMMKLSDCNGISTHNHLVCKWICNHLAKLAYQLGVCLQTKWLWSSLIVVNSLSDITPVSSKEFLYIHANAKWRFTLKRLCDMIRTHRWNDEMNTMMKLL